MNRRRSLSVKDLIKVKGQLGRYRLKPTGSMIVSGAYWRTQPKHVDPHGKIDWFAVGWSGYDSMLEVDYAKHLDLMKKARQIIHWKHHPITFILPGKNNRYTPDFLVQLADRSIQIHETKGAWIKNRREGIVKFKTAAGLNPWARFVLVSKERGRWRYQYAAQS